MLLDQDPGNEHSLILRILAAERAKFIKMLVDVADLKLFAIGA